jgi:hypothetical protein
VFRFYEAAVREIRQSASSSRSLFAQTCRLKGRFAPNPARAATRIGRPNRTLTLSKK